MIQRQSVYGELARRWPSNLVSRDKIEAFTGGILKSKSLANLDSRGEGPKDRIRVGRKVAYRVDKLVEWLEERTSTIDCAEDSNSNNNL
jgi:hypothetical protein